MVLFGWSWQGREATRIRLGESPSACRQDEDWHSADVGSQCLLDGGDDRRSGHHHPRPAAVGRVVDGPVPILGPRADVVQKDPD